MRSYYPAALVVAVLFAFVDIAGAEPPVSFAIRSQTVSQADAERVIAVFKENCAPLREYWDELEGVEVEVRDDELATNRLEKGWKTRVQLRLKVPENPRLIPVYDPRTGVIAGHTLYYDVGSGREPGMFASKRVSQLLCNLPINQDGDTFVSIPGFDFLKYE